MKVLALLTAIAAPVLIASCDDKAPVASPNAANGLSIEVPDAAAQAASNARAPPASAASIVLDDLIGFSDVHACEANPATQEMFKSLLVLTSNVKELTLRHLVVRERFRPAFGNPHLTKERKGELTYYEAAVPVSGLWHGLKVIKRSCPGWWCSSTVAELTSRAPSTSAVAAGQLRGWPSEILG